MFSLMKAAALFGKPELIRYKKILFRSLHVLRTKSPLNYSKLLLSSCFLSDLSTQDIFFDSSIETLLPSGRVGNDRPAARLSLHDTLFDEGFKIFHVSQVFFQIQSFFRANMGTSRVVGSQFHDIGMR